MVNSRPNSPINSPDSPCSSSLDEHGYIIIDEHDYIVEFKRDSMKIISPDLLHKTMKYAGMNKGLEEDQNKIITLLTYHNQITEFIDNDTRIITDFPELTKSASGQSKNLIYNCMIAFTTTGQALDNNADVIGKWVVDLMKNTLGNFASGGTYSLSAAIIGYANTYFNPPSNFDRAIKTFKHEVSNTAQQGISRLAEQTAAASVRKLGKFMQDWRSYYNTYNMKITHNDFKVLKMLLPMLRHDTADNVTIDKLYKATFQMTEEITTNRPFVYYPTVKGDALKEIKKKYFNNNWNSWG